VHRFAFLCSIFFASETSELYYNPGQKPPVPVLTGNHLFFAYTPMKKHRLFHFQVESSVYRILPAKPETMSLCPVFLLRDSATAYAKTRDMPFALPWLRRCGLCSFRTCYGTILTKSCAPLCFAGTTRRGYPGL
jgi:hypothetical protein